MPPTSANYAAMIGEFVSTVSCIHRLANCCAKWCIVVPQSRKIASLSSTRSQQARPIARLASTFRANRDIRSRSPGARILSAPPWVRFTNPCRSKTVRSLRSVGWLTSKIEANSSKWILPRLAMSAAIFSCLSAGNIGGLESLAMVKRVGWLESLPSRVIRGQARSKVLVARARPANRPSAGRPGA